MNKIIHIITLLIISVSLFFLERDLMFSQEIVEGSSISSTVFIGVLTAVSIFSFFHSKHSLKNIRITRRFTILMVTTYILSLLFAIIHPFISRATYVFIILPLFLYYYTATMDTQNFGRILVWGMTSVAVLLSVYFILNYYSNINYEFERQHNASYIIIYFLPFMLCLKKRTLRLAAIALVVFVEMISLKRGGFVAVLFGIAAYALMLISVQGKNVKFRAIFIVLATCLGLFYLVQYINGVVLGDLMFERMRTIEETEGSGRFTIYAQYFDFISSDSIIHWLFGHGWQGSILDSNVGATCHNDFIEIFVDFGLIGLITYIAFWGGLVGFCKLLIKRRHEFAPAMGASVAIFAVNSMVSHIFIYSWYMIIFALFWGFIVSSFYEGEKSKMINYYHQ